MTKLELLKLLEGLNDDSIIVLSTDEEGNGYRELETVEVGWKYHEGEIGLAKLTELTVKQGYSEEDLMDNSDAVDAIVLY